MKINWFPGHMKKTIDELADKIKLADVVLYVLDSRAPKSTLNPKFDKIIGSKPIIFVLPIILIKIIFSFKIIIIIIFTIIIIVFPITIILKKIIFIRFLISILFHKNHRFTFLLFFYFIFIE